MRQLLPATTGEPDLEAVYAFPADGRYVRGNFVSTLDGAIELGGRLPINTHGGQLGEAYLHGMNGIAEGVRQIRGTSVNQVPDVSNVLVTGGTGVPTSALLLSTER